MTATEEFVRLPDTIATELLAKGETGMGYRICDVILSNGQQFKQAVVMLPYIVAIRGLSKIPFEATDVSNLVLTHDKWDWANETWNQGK